MKIFSTQLNSTQLNSTQLNSTQLNSTQLNSTQLLYFSVPALAGTMKAKIKKFVREFYEMDFNQPKQTSAAVAEKSVNKNTIF